MNKKILKVVSLTESKSIIEEADLELLRNGKGTEKVSLEIKKIIVLCIVLYWIDCSMYI